ncbi:MAG: ribonuclease III [Desulfobulbaceae bacterium]|nr:ribonuclease III [Desulfobulbaceae bacterium]
MTTLATLLKRNREQLHSFEKKLGYTFVDQSHLQKAFVHSSYSFEHGKDIRDNNETLEFLGDAVLDLVVGYILFTRFPQMQEGDLTRLRSALVQESHLAVMAREIGLGDHLLLGKGEDASQGREKPSILSCAFEAVIGAVFLDGGYENASAVVEKHVSPWIDERRKTLTSADSKSRLQEMIQEKHNQGPIYVLEKTEGPDHAKVFHVTVQFQGKVLAHGTATNKKEAEQSAAAEAVRVFADLHL